MISLILPTYKNPDYLDLAVRSALDGQGFANSEVIVVVDGFADESADVLSKYPNASVLVLEENMGMQYALNIGVMNASNPYILIANDDNVFCRDWDTRTMDAFRWWGAPDGSPEHPAENLVVTVNQVEPSPGIYDFEVRPFGRTAQEFDYDGWWNTEPSLSEERYSVNGRIFPFAMTKKLYQAVGGFDTFYQSPFYCDLDFFLRLELLGTLKFVRWHKCHFYHFGSIATKNRQDAEAVIFKQSESLAAQQFEYKWGYRPDIIGNARDFQNSRLPDKQGRTINGITFPRKPKLIPKHPAYGYKQE